MRGIPVTQSNHADAALAAHAWLQGRKDVDARRIGLRGVSFASYFCLQWAAALGEHCAGVVASYVAHEPGLRTLFESASPTFKVRFMMMAGFEDEAGFDPIPWARRISAPVLIQAGEDDELSPLAFTERVFEAIQAPRHLVVYEGHKHVLRGGGAVAAGENPDTQFTDWLVDRLQGRPAMSARTWIHLNGQTVTEPA